MLCADTLPLQAGTRSCYCPTRELLSSSHNAARVFVWPVISWRAWAWLHFKHSGWCASKKSICTRGGTGKRVRKESEIAGMTLRANVFLSPGARFHPETESHSMGETVFVNSVHSRCLPAPKKPPAQAVSVPAATTETPLWFKGLRRCLL